MLAAVIAVVGTLLGAVVGVMGALAISRADRLNDQREAARQALATYLGALYPAVSELRQIPPLRPASKLVKLRGKLERDDVAWVRQRRREHLLYGFRHRESADRLAATVAQVQVSKLPAELRAAIDRANNYIERLGEQRTPELLAEWSSVHDDLMHGQALLDAWTPRRGG